MVFVCLAGTWPRPGLAEPRSASIAGFGLFHQHTRKGKIVIVSEDSNTGLLNAKH